MTKFFVSPRTGETISVEPLRIGKKNGGIRNKSRKYCSGKHPNSLKNLWWCKKKEEGQKNGV